MWDSKCAECRHIMEDEKRCEHCGDDYALFEGLEQSPQAEQATASCLSELLTSGVDKDRLPPCPFCGAGPYAPGNVKKNKTTTACANNCCPIFGVNMTIKQWRARV